MISTNQILSTDLFEKISSIPIDFLPVITFLLSFDTRVTLIKKSNITKKEHQHGIYYFCSSNKALFC
jgi:hypothetical protein